MVIGNMKRDIKNIIKRIIVGVGIALVLSFINSCEVKAIAFNPPKSGFQTQHCDLDNCALSWYDKSAFSNTSIDGINFMIMNLPSNAHGVRVYYDYTAYQPHYLLSGYVWLSDWTNATISTKSGTCSISNLFQDDNQSGVLSDLSTSNIRRFDCELTDNFQYIYIGYSNANPGEGSQVLIGSTLFINDIDSNIRDAINQATTQIIAQIAQLDNSLVAHIDAQAQNIIINLQEIIRAIKATDVGVLKSTMDSVDANQKETNKKMDQLNDNITNSDTSDASSSADSFFSGFESNDYGLSSIVTAPLNLIKSITSSTCKPLGFKAPFVDQNVTLPCMSAIYKEFFGSFLTLYQTITFGIVAYWVCVKIFFMVQGFKDPDSDKIEVLDL